MSNAPTKLYSSQEVVKATGVTYRQLDYWDRTDLVSPTGVEATGSGSRRKYTLEDTLKVYVVHDLLNLMNLQAVRKCMPTIDWSGSEITLTTNSNHLLMYADLNKMRIELRRQINEAQ